MSATAIASVVQDIPLSSCSHTLTPIQAAGLKTNYIQQIKELYQLLEMGALDDNDFACNPEEQDSTYDGGYLGPHTELNL